MATIKSRADGKLIREELAQCVDVRQWEDTDEYQFRFALLEPGPQCFRFSHFWGHYVYLHAPRDAYTLGQEYTIEVHYDWADDLPPPRD